MPPPAAKYALAIFLIAGLTGALAKSTTTVTPSHAANLTVALGRTDFRTYCAACHGVAGQGDGTVAEFLTIAAADLTQLKKMNAGRFPRERITEVIDGRREVKVHGARDMPVWGEWFSREAASSKRKKKVREEIVGQRIEALVDYIETIQE